MLGGDVLHVNGEIGMRCGNVVLIVSALTRLSRSMISSAVLLVCSNSLNNRLLVGRIPEDSEIVVMLGLFARNTTRYCRCSSLR